MELKIPDAARSLGVSQDTVRRYIRTGRVAWRKDDRGRYLVEVEERREAPAEPDDREVRLRAQAEAERWQALATELRAQRDQLQVHVAMLQRQLTSAAESEARSAQERAELRQLLATAQQQIGALIEAPNQPREREGSSSPAELPRHPRWWPFR